MNKEVVGCQPTILNWWDELEERPRGRREERETVAIGQEEVNENPSV